MFSEFNFGRGVALSIWMLLCHTVWHVQYESYFTHMGTFKPKWLTAPTHFAKRKTDSAVPIWVKYIYLFLGSCHNKVRFSKTQYSRTLVIHIKIISIQFVVWTNLILNIIQWNYAKTTLAYINMCVQPATQFRKNGIISFNKLLFKNNLRDLSYILI